MSAIWGIVSRNSKDIHKQFEAMTEVTKQYRTDRTDCATAVGAEFGCGHAYITKESYGDVSPVYDEADGILFTADAFLTNREDVIAVIRNRSGRDDSYEKMGDAYLCYLAWKAMGETFAENLRGSFAMAIYDVNRGKLLLYTDQLARRYLAYSVSDDFVCFSSTYGPIKSCYHDPIPLDHQTMCEFYLNLNAMTFKSPDRTVYQGVFHVNPAQMVTIDLRDGKKTRKTYYEVGKNQKKLKVSDEECKELFVETYRKTVKSMLRSSKETGILLSGGLDSSSVAALAADELAKDGKMLYSYTMLPASDYPYTNDRSISENEKPYVEAQKELHPNLLTHYVTGDDGCIFTRLNEYSALFETPFKVGNMDNIIRMLKMADQDGCKLMLGGANGNASVSYGGILLLLSGYLVRLRFVKAYRALCDYCRKWRIPRKRLLKYYFQNLSRTLKSLSGYRIEGYIRQEFCKKYHLQEIGRRVVHECGTDFFSSKSQRLKYIYNPMFFQHSGLFDTYRSLLYGVYSVDPTETVEMIEFCLTIPLEYQVKDGIERRTIREYMKDYLPECVYSDKVGRGIQGADTEFRVEREWEYVKAGILQNLKNAHIMDYMDENRVQELIQTVEASDHNFPMDDLHALYYVCNLGAFLNENVKS